jgi:hypothetical protein
MYSFLPQEGEFALYCTIQLTKYTKEEPKVKETQQQCEGAGGGKEEGHTPHKFRAK